MTIFFVNFRIQTTQFNLMKDSKNKLEKSSSESKILEPKIIPPMPKDKRTKEYKEWYKKYGEIKADTKVSSVRKTKTKN